MDKETFLRLQYLRMINSERSVAELWRSSSDRFIVDMWDKTPEKPGGRFLEPIDPAFGFAPENVEWHFPRVKRKRQRAKLPTPGCTHEKIVATRLTKQERKLAEMAAKEARRKAIAEQFQRWDLKRLNSGGR